MIDSCYHKAKLNTVVSLIGQFVTLICGLIVPSLMINAFGSEVYGATASIAQFLAYITLIEGGIGGVARAALYGPLARNNMQEISVVLAQVKRFFRVIAGAFVGYVLFLACSFKFISNIQALDWLSTFLLVVVLSISTFAQYYIGVSNSILLQAAQKTYITRLISIAGTILNTVMIVLLVHWKCNIIVVRLVSSCVFVLQPVMMWLYVKKNFSLVRSPQTKTDYLKQRWNALGQHIAWFLHSNTDIAILTVFADLGSVAVYSVYNMVVSHIQSFAGSFATGMEALFGDMLAKKEEKQLHNSFNYYETIISLVVIILFTVMAVLIVPFVRLYTAGVDDQNYIEPLFAMLLVISSALYCLRLPYHSIVTAAGHFKQTKVAAYGEVLINVSISLATVSKLGLVGVVIGTIAATLFRFLFYVFYLSRNIFNRSLTLFLKRQAANIIAFAGGYLIASYVISKIVCNDYLQWGVCGVITTTLVVAITLCVNAVFYRREMHAILAKFLNKNKREMS